MGTTQRHLQRNPLQKKSAHHHYKLLVNGNSNKDICQSSLILKQFLVFSFERDFYIAYYSNKAYSRVKLTADYCVI